MANEVTIRINISDEDILDSVFSALQVETTAKEIERGNLQLNKTETDLVIIVNAVDFTATRALTNSIMRLVKTSLDIANEISK
ncbi:MAG: KEOPS complex subunit Pcc1 [Candidatus Kariarchaeaceae archaeon]|jgi:tRNA threonylcarbamoyladenosine modification (KEOPS) complex  Pcc1 subunit